MTHEPVRTYYASFGEREWTRLENQNDGFVEFAITCQMLSKYLKPNSRILDIGGGPGRYSIWLAKQGHRVVLSDLSPNLLSIAQTKIDEAGVRINVEEILYRLLLVQISPGKIMVDISWCIILLTPGTYFGGVTSKLIPSLG
jgi:2-polyprenyl-3-methyl-5-hydroxy-6-metoxy-1,4-benzoquinol methylase